MLKRIRIGLFNIKMHIKKKNFYNCLSQKHVYISPKANVSFDSEFEGKNRVAEGSILKDVSLGYGSYCGRDCYFERTQVGRYCSRFASNTYICFNASCFLFITSKR